MPILLIVRSRARAESLLCGSFSVWESPCLRIDLRNRPVNFIIGGRVVEQALELSQGLVHMALFSDQRGSEHLERSLHRILLERQLRLFQRLLRLPVEAQGLHNQTLAAGRLTLTQGEHLLEG